MKSPIRFNASTVLYLAFAVLCVIQVVSAKKSSSAKDKDDKDDKDDKNKSVVVADDAKKADEGEELSYYQRATNAAALNAAYLLGLGAGNYDSSDKEEEVVVVVEAEDSSKKDKKLSKKKKKEAAEKEKEKEKKKKKIEKSVETNESSSSSDDNENDGSSDKSSHKKKNNKSGKSYSSINRSPAISQKITDSSTRAASKLTSEGVVADVEPQGFWSGLNIFAVVGVSAVILGLGAFLLIKIYMKSQSDL